MEPTVIGDAVNLASRLEGTTKQYGVPIVLSGGVAEHVRGEIPLRLLDIVRVKGRAAPVEIFTVPLDAKRNPMIGSTDVGDVSWAVPTVQAHAPTVAIGTPFHTWQIVAQGKEPAAHKAMVQVSKAMASLAIAAITDPALVAAAKADHARQLKTTPYICPLPDTVNPPLDMSRG
jgi:hypothetical protein